MEQLPPFMVLYLLGTGHYISHALYVAAKLGVADLLVDGPQSVEALAAGTGTDAPSLRRMLRLLVSVGVFVEEDDGRVSSNPVGDAMRKGAFNAAVQLFAGRSVWEPWGDLITTVRSGEPAFERVYGVDPFEYFSTRAEEAAIFDEAMASFTAGISVAVEGAYDFSPLQKIIDVGGGEGALLTGILRKHPRLQGVVFDLPRTEVRARAQIERAGLLSRYEFVGGDFFDCVPRGFDAYLLKHVIHDWNDERATRILRNVRDVIAPSGKLLVVEGVYPARITHSLESRGAAANDCNMMVVAGGRQRSEEEFRALFSSAGFRLNRIVPTAARVCVIEGVPS